MKELGSVSFSKDILGRSGIGLWAIEIDAGKEPRIYTDDTMLRLLGLDTGLSPEEIYSEWESRVDKSSGGFPAEAIERMKTGHGEAQYRWNHPDGSVRTILCAGTRSTEYTAGIRIEGTFQDVTGIILAGEKQKMQMEERLARQSSFTEFFLDTFISAYYVNLDEGEFKIYRSPERLEADQTEGNDYYVFFEDYVNEEVHPDDRKELLEILKQETIKKMLAEQKEFTHVFRDIGGEKERTFRLQVIRGTDASHAAFGFIDITEEVAEQNRRLSAEKENRNLIEYITAKYQLVFMVRLADAAYTELKKAGSLPGDDNNYENFIQLTDFFVNNVVYAPEKTMMRREMNFDTIREKIAEFGSYTVEFRNRINGRLTWNEMYVTSIGEGMALVGFSERNADILYKHLNDKMDNDIYALFVVDVDDEIIKIEKVSPWAQEMEQGEVIPYAPTMEYYASKLDPESAEVFRKLADIEYVKNILAHEDKYAYSYRSKNLDNKWVTMTCYAILRHDDGTPAVFTMGFSIMDNFGADRQELQIRLADALTEATEEKKRNDILHDIINSSKWSFFVNADDEIMASRFSDITEMPPDEDIPLPGYDWLDNVHPDYREATEKAFRATIEDHTCRTPYDVTYYMKDITGVYRWYHAAGRIVREEDGTGEFFGIHIDITDQIEQQIENQKRLQENLEIIEALAADYSSVYYIDLGSEKITPYSMNEETQRGMAEMFRGGVLFPDAFRAYVDRFVYEPDREMMLTEGRKNIVLEKLSESSSYSITFRGLNEGDVSFCEMKYVAAHRENGEIKSVALGFAYRDNEIMAQYINEKLVAEYISAFLVDLDTDKYRIYLRPDSTNVMDREDRIWSLAMTEFAGECDPEYSELVKNIGSPEFLRKELAEVDRREYLYRSPSASKPWRRAVVQVIDRKNGIPDTVVATFMAIDDYQSKIKDQQKQLETQQKQLEEALVEAQSASRAKTEFLFNMSHDIRTPMNAILGFTDMGLKYINNKKKVKDCLKKTKESGSLLLHLINSVLDTSRIESNNATLNEMKGDVYYSFINIESTMAEEAEAKGITIIYEFGDIEDRYVYADFDRCARVFTNLITNAIKYTKKGGYVKVRCEQASEEKDGSAMYRYTFEDNGIGMSEEFQKHMFEPFTREQSSTASGIQGTGLGLSVCRTLVEFMDGTIECSSVQGSGTVFTVTLPFRIQEGSDYTDPLTREVVTGVKKKEKRADFRGRRALLVEDNELNREIAADILNEEGITTEEAEDGSKAVEMMRENGPDYYDFILMDIQMPVMNGYEATGEIRKMYPDSGIPIIAVSANAFTEDKIASLNAGMNDHVAKPINVKELFSCLAKYIK